MFDWLSSAVHLFGGIGSIGAVLSEVFKFIWSLFQTITYGILRIIKAVGDFFWGIVKSVGKFLTHIWDGFFKKLLDKFFHLMFKIHDWIEAHLRPIIDFIKKVRAILDRLYLRYVKPFLTMIHHIRQVLLVLRLMHVKFAQELDAKLAGIEQKVSSIFLQLRGVLTLTLDLLNVIIDPTKLLRRPTLIISLRRSIPALIRAITGMPPGWFFPSRKPNAPRGFGPLPANFDPANLDHNPPASYYLTLDDPLPLFSFLSTNEAPADSDIDLLTPLDFWQEEFLARAVYESGLEGAHDCDLSLIDALEHNGGCLDDAAEATAAFALALGE